MPRQTDLVAISVRLDPKLHALLRELAQRDDRTFNSYVVHTLREHAERTEYAQSLEHVVAASSNWLSDE